jgi:hypothetical protein
VHGVVLKKVVVTREQVGVLFSNPHVDARLSHGLDCSNVVPVAMGLEDRGHSQLARDLKESVVFVGGVQQGRLARSATTNDVDVVGDWPHHEAVYLA